MAKRPSNRERMQRKALEAELTAKENSEKKKKKVTKKKKTVASAPTGGRLKLVWKVFDPRLKEVAAFPYPQKSDADAKAAQLTKKSGQEHRVRGIKVPLDEVI